MGSRQRDGEDLVKKGEELTYLLDFHKVEGRFFVTHEDADAIESEDEAERKSRTVRKYINRKAT